MSMHTLLHSMTTMDLFICVTWSWTDSFAWHDSFTCVPWLIYMCDMTHFYVWHDSFKSVAWLIHTCAMTHSHVCHDLFICVTIAIALSHSCHAYKWFTSHIWVSHVTHINTSCHTCECVMPHVTWMVRAMAIASVCERVMSRIWMSHVTHRAMAIASVCERVMSCVCGKVMSRVIEWLLTHSYVTHGTGMNVTYEHIRTHINTCEHIWTHMNTWMARAIAIAIHVTCKWVMSHHSNVTHDSFKCHTYEWVSRAL